MAVKNKTRGTTTRTIDNSSNLTKISYKGPTKELVIGFTSGAEYKYSGVPWETVSKLLDAESKGGYFQKHIARSYEYERLKAPDANPGGSDAK